MGTGDDYHVASGKMAPDAASVRTMRKGWRGLVAERERAAMRSSASWSMRRGRLRAVPPLRRRHAHTSPEPAREVALIGEPAGQRYLRERHPAAHQRFGVRNPDRVQEHVRRRVEGGVNARVRCARDSPATAASSVTVSSR